MQDDKHELFKKRWERSRKMGVYKYSLFLALIYSATVVFMSLLWDYKDSNLPFSEILTFFDKDLTIKTGTFFALGIIFGFYHFKKSEMKYEEGL